MSRFEQADYPTGVVLATLILNWSLQLSRKLKCIAGTAVLDVSTTVSAIQSLWRCPASGEGLIGLASLV
jgi:hypothetical protein